jgi:hypothetical protein
LGGTGKLQGEGMSVRYFIAAIMLAALAARSAGGQPIDTAKYPAWDGQWVRNIGAQWDPCKPRGLGQQAPLSTT